MDYTAILLIGSIFLIGVIPLYLAIKIMGGEATILRIILAKLSGLVIGALGSLFLGVIGGVTSLIITILIYKVVFDLGFLRTIIVWLIEAAIMVGLVILAIFVFGVSLSGISPS